MDPCELLGYVIVAIIIALLIHLLLKMNNSTEGMNNTSCKRNLFPASADGVNIYSPVVPVEDKIREHKLEAKYSTPIIEGMTNSEPAKYENKEEHETKVAGSTKGTDCGICDTSSSVDDYIRESLLHNALLCKDKDVFDKDAIDKHRDSVISFRNNVNQTSNTEDMVDKVNLLYLSGSSDISRTHKDAKISDLFDKLTKSGNTLYSQNCNRITEESGPKKRGDYLLSGHNGGFYSPDVWVYNSDKASSSGEFMPGVWPSDKNLEDYQAPNN
jgi:hypothetical protein